MKIGVKAVPMAARIQAIRETINIYKVISLRDIALIHGLAESHISRLLRFYTPGVNKIKHKQTLGGSGNWFYLYFTGDLNDEKRLLIKKRY